MARAVSLRERMALRTGRMTRRSHCQRKHKFTEAKAIRLARKRTKELGERITAYPCFYCNWWHIGHEPSD